MANTELDPEIRNLIDARLDAIEDVLRQVHVQNSERRHIVSEVETQIFELLGRGGENLTQGDVLAVLDSLDPPESYIPQGHQEAIPALAAQHGQETARPSKLPLLLIGVGLAFLIDLVVAGIGLAGRELFQSENATETLVGVTIVLTALFAATAMVWLKRSFAPQFDLNYLRVAAVLPLLFMDYLFAVALVHARDNLLLCLSLVVTCLLVNGIAMRRFWHSIPAE